MCKLIDLKVLLEIGKKITEVLDGFNLAERKLILEKELEVVNMFIQECSQKALLKTRAIVDFKDAQDKDK